MTDDERIVREHKQKLALREKQRRAAAAKTVRDPRRAPDPASTKRRSSGMLSAEDDDVPLIEAQDVRHGVPPTRAAIPPTRPTTPMFKRPAPKRPGAEEGSLHGEGVDEDADSLFDAPRKSDTEVAGDPDAPTALGGTNWRAAVLMALNHLESANAQLREVDDPRAQVANADLALAYRVLADILKDDGG